MTIIICGASAWQYHRTPPLLRDAELDPKRIRASAIDDLDLALRSKALRANASETERLIGGRLLHDLKGLTLPVHVMVDSPSPSLRRTRLVAPHRMPSCLSGTALQDLGNGLKILPPTLSVLIRPDVTSPIRRALIMFEACGIFSLTPHTSPLELTAHELTLHGSLCREQFAHSGVFGYSDELGRPLGEVDPLGLRRSWTPAFDRMGNLTDLWLRPPLTNVEELEALLPSLRGIRGIKEAARGLEITRNGASSPAEVFCALMLCSGTWAGGESWGSPDLNRRIALSPEAQALAHRSFCIADILWPESSSILEVEGREYHADRQGFRIATGRRAALESMGYNLAEITYEQMANLELFDAVLPSLGKRLGFEPRTRTEAFLKRRNRLHSELFSKPYEA